MSENYENSPLTHGQRTYLENQKKFGLLFGIFIAVFFLFNITSGVATNLLNIILGIIIYRGINRRFTAATILEHPNLTNKQLFIKSIWAFTWRTFLAFFAIPVIFVTIIEPDTRRGQALGLFVGYFIINYVLSADRGFWVIRKFRVIPNEPVKIKTATGLSANQKTIRNALIVLAVLFGIILSGQIFNKPKEPENTTPKPLPPTRTEEMQQRAEANTLRTGDSRVQEVFEKNRELYRSLEQASAKLIEACEKINGDVMFELNQSSQEVIEREIATLEEFEKAALELKDVCIVFEETIKRELAAKFTDSPEVMRSALNQAREGSLLFHKWVQAATRYSQAGLRHMAFFQDTGRIDEALELAAAQSAVDFDEISKKIDERIQSNFEKMEAVAPR